MGWGAVVGQIAGTVLNSAGGIINHFMDRKANEIQQDDAQRHQFELAEHIGKNQIQWNVQDLKAAGLNPILAATGGGFHGVSAPGAGISAAGSPDMDLSGAFNAARRLEEVEKENVKIARDTAESQINLNKELQNKAKSDSLAAEAAAWNNSAQAHKASLEAEMILPEQREQLRAGTKKILQDARTSSANESYLLAQYEHLAKDLGFRNASELRDEIMYWAERSGKAGGKGAGIASAVLDSTYRGIRSGVTNSARAYMKYVGEPFEKGVRRIFQRDGKSSREIYQESKREYERLFGKP